MSFKICTVGCGNMAVNGHGPSYRKYAMNNPDVEFAACCDINESRAMNFKQEFGFARYYSDLDVMLDNEKPDAVCLVVPVNLTSSLSVRILEKGYPLLLEKPPGMNRSETIGMIQAAKKGNVPNQVAFNRRYIPHVRQLKNFIEKNNCISSSMNIQYQMFRVGRKDPDFAVTAIHGIDLVKYFAGSDYKTVQFHYQYIHNSGSSVANIQMLCEFESGVCAQLGFYPLSGSVVEKLDISILDNTFSLELPLEGSMALPGKLLHKEKNELKRDFADDILSADNDGFVLSGFYDENKAFFEDIRNGRKPAGDIESCLQTVEIADCIRNRLTYYE